MSRPLVVAGCPIRNRGWIAERHAAALAACGQKAKVETKFHYLVYDCEDDTHEVLLESPEVDSIEVMNTGDPGWKRGYSEEARVRNCWVESALEEYPEATHLWFVDSDVLPDGDCLALLLEADKDIVAAVVRNGERAWNFMLGKVPEVIIGAEAFRLAFGYDAGPVVLWRPKRSGEEGKALSRTAPFAVEMTGACILARRTAWEKVRYAGHRQGEDIAWCQSAQAFGHELWVHPRARTTHYMDADNLEEVWR